MKLPAAAYSAEVATSATKAGSCGISCEILRPVGQSRWAACRSHTPLRKATEGSPRLHPCSSLLRRSSCFGCEGWKLRGIRRRRINQIAERKSTERDAHAYELCRPEEMKGCFSDPEIPTSDTHTTARRRVGMPTHSPVLPAEWPPASFLLPTVPPPFHQKF
jgi:hypothetical protein